MNMRLFEHKLSALIEECGGIALGNLSVSVMQVGTWRASLDEEYERYEQPIKINIDVHALSLGDWQPNSSKR